MVSNIVGTPVTGQNLYGRTYEMAELRERLESGQHVLLLAPRRVGKSSLMQELRRTAPSDWAVFYSDLERGTEAADCIADMIAHLAVAPRTRTWLDTMKDNIPFRSTIAELLGRVENLDIQGVRIELRQAMADDWRDTADKLLARLAKLPDGLRITFILDELPMLLANILKQPDGVEQATELLNWLRALRQDQALTGKVTLVVGGSIGLQSLLRRHNLSAPINDFNPLAVEPWQRATAIAFLTEVSKSSAFSIAPLWMDAMLERLGEAVPYHVQLFVQELRAFCRGDANAIDTAALDRVFRNRLSGPHLDHYAQRLAIMLPAEELDLAQTILDLTCRDAGGAELASLAARHGQSYRDILRMLQEDGYLTEDDETPRFRSHLLRDYWRRHRTGKEQSR